MLNVSFLEKLLPGFSSIAIGFIVLVIFVLKINYETKKDIKIMENEIMGFMKEVSESIKEERKLMYTMTNSLDREIHDVIQKIGECVGELRGRKETEKCGKG
jgi:uncharacterized protein YoxC